MNQFNNSEQSSQATRNAKAIERLEHEMRQRQTRADRVGHWITLNSGRLSVVLVHAVWFAVWIVINVGLIPGIEPFDPFPFIFLTLVVSLESIFLSYFLLMGQNAQSSQADRLAHLDLQVNLLAEQEMTEALKMLRALCVAQGVDQACSPKLEGMIKQTHIETLADALEVQRRGVKIVKEV